MGRKYIDCRDFPGETKCSLAFAADSEEELLEAAVQHGVNVHGYANNQETRDKIRQGFKEGTPPL